MANAGFDEGASGALNLFKGIRVLKPCPGFIALNGRQRIGELLARDTIG